MKFKDFKHALLPNKHIKIMYVKRNYMTKFECLERK